MITKHNDRNGHKWYHNDNGDNKKNDNNDKQKYDNMIITKMITTW